MTLHKKAPVSYHGSRGFSFEFCDGPAFRKTVAIASVPRGQMNYAKSKTFMGDELHVHDSN